MEQIDSHETNKANRTEDNRGHWRIERSKLEEYIAGAYTSTAEAIQRGIELTDENEE